MEEHQGVLPGGGGLELGSLRPIGVGQGVARWQLFLRCDKVEDTEVLAQHHTTKGETQG